MLKSRVVSMAPIQTLLQGTWTSGRYLKIMAKSTVTTLNETTKSRMCASQPASGRLLPRWEVKAASAVEIAIDTSNRKPMPKTIEKDKNRVRIWFQMLTPGLVFTFQMVFKEFCSC